MEGIRLPAGMIMMKIYGICGCILCHVKLLYSPLIITPHVTSVCVCACSCSWRLLCPREEEKTLRVSDLAREAGVKRKKMCFYNVTAFKA